jgi:hypothetical protein
VFVTGERLHLSDDQAGRIELFVIRVALTAGATALSWYLIEQPFRRRKPASNDAATTTQLSRTGIGAIGLAALFVGVVWVAAAPSAPAQTDFSSKIAPSSVSTKNAEPPISLLWFGDSVAWTIGGGIVEFPWPTGYDSPFDPTRIVIWNKGISECSFMQQQTKSFGILRSGGGSCVGWETNWRDASASFSPDAIVWSGALRDTYDVLVNGTWVAFGSPEWIALYNAELDKAAAIATENGIPLVIVSQADPKVLPDEKREDSLTASNIGKFTQLRQIQREYALVNSDTTVSIDLNELLCAGGPCEELTPSGKTIRIDHLHYSTAGAAHIAPTVTTAIESAFKQWHAQHRN